MRRQAGITTTDVHLGIDGDCIRRTNRTVVSGCDSREVAAGQSDVFPGTCREVASINAVDSQGLAVGVIRQVEFDSMQLSVTELVPPVRVLVHIVTSRNMAIWGRFNCKNSLLQTRGHELRKCENSLYRNQPVTNRLTGQ